MILPSFLLLDCMTLETVPLRDLDLPIPEELDAFPDFSFKDFDLFIPEVYSDPVDAILSLVFSF